MTGTPQGRRLLAGRYELHAELGRGGMGVVWRGVDTQLGREVAVKELRLGMELDEAELRSRWERMMREARSAARVNHPNVIRVYDVVVEDGLPWIVMEYVEGRSLSDVIADSGPLPPERVAAVGIAVLDALTAAHRAGILHRDVKPSNVLLTGDGRVVLTDFGIARLEGDRTLTATGAVLGSPAYMAPERAQGQHPGPESDLWALGATLYTAVEGRAPFERDTPLAVMAAVVSGEPDPYEKAGPLQPVLAALLQPEPAARPSHEEARRMLRAVCDARPVAVPRAVPPATPAVRPPRTPAAGPTLLALPVEPVPRRRVGLALLGAALAVAGIGAYASGVLRLSGQPAGAAPSPSRGAQDTGSVEYRPYRDRAGFALKLPVGWQRTSSGTRQIDFIDPTNTHLLRVGWSRHPGANLVQDRRNLERKTYGDRPDYDRITLRKTRLRDWEAAEWEFTFRDSRGRLRHAYNIAFLVHDDLGYAIHFSTLEEDWARMKPVCQAALESFEPAD
ncbi:hypothetical protein TH66_22190 [Carbonactinospora thermoautotrophica]|nr:serine/threonine-protein kinase [Carbonactinospora thermoautotrophica]KWW98030.1 hypothetical protein TH66_22190 [Carbonactinospora thermoautotrophica]